MASTRIIESGKYKGKTLAECPREYIVWASKHEKNFAERNQWISRDTRFLLEREIEAPRAEYWDENRACLCYRDTRKPTGSLEGIDFGDTPMRWNAQEECFEEVPNVKVDLGLKGNLYSGKAFSILR